jgi:glyoxylase-like metal-dependent hydrolase (beta-lactamase superfamily II)
MVRAQHQIPEDYFRLTVHRKLEEGDGLDLGGIPFSVVHIPGHSGGSIGLLNDEYKLFVAGDTIYADGAIGRYDLHSADAGQLKASLERIAQLGVDILLPGHNRIVRGGAQPMIHDTVRTWASML